MYSSCPSPREQNAYLLRSEDNIIRKQEWE